VNSVLPETTWAACLTPPGTAALAAVAVRGPDAWRALRPLFRPHSGAELSVEPEVGRFWLGRLQAELSDDMVLAVKRGGPAPWLELHCHGGREVVRLVLEVLATHGIPNCSWQQLERMSAVPASRAEALAALAEARTPRTAAILLDQLHGALDRALHEVHASLESNDAGAAAGLLSDLLRWAPLGAHLTAPWRVVVAGAPNVGKSSLVNALAGYQRSVVSAVPGTTRDVVTTLIAVDGWPVELADTAGIHHGAVTLEREGVARAQTAVAAADLCLWVLDASAAPVWPATRPETLRFVINKTDLPPAWDGQEVPDACRVSARTGAGLAELCQALAHWLVPELPPAGAAVPFTTALTERLREALQCCGQGNVRQAAAGLQSIGKSALAEEEVQEARPT
jgi:tRNA modification GTPase